FRKLVLLPQRAAVGAVERLQRAAVVGDERIPRIEAHAAEGRNVARPDLPAARLLIAADTSLIGRGADLAALHDRGADHVGDALELGSALGQGDGCLPAHAAVAEGERGELAAGEAGEGGFAVERDAGRRANDE